MKILHTSDWHLGRLLYGRKRYQEFELFLTWLEETIKTQKIDVLLIAGDIFDTNTPSNRAQELYFNFLCHIAKSNCRHIVVISGNHDSPTLLDASKSVLKALDVHVVGVASDEPKNEVIVLRNSEKQPEAIICAVPYLRDRDIRKVDVGESIEDKDSKFKIGIEQHYAQVCEYAKSLQQTFLEDDPEIKIPIIGMGHLFAAGGKTLDGDGVRELYVGSLAHIGSNIFPEYLDYMALGHLHVAQIVGGQERIRYCGSPIPMGFGEAKQQKLILTIEFKHNDMKISEQLIPSFQSLVRITGDLDLILQVLNGLLESKSNAWLEIEYTGKDIIGNLPEQINALVDGSDLEVRRIKNKRLIERVMQQSSIEETLDDLNEKQVFDRCLDAHQIHEDRREALMHCYQEILTELTQQDVNAE